MVIKTYTECVIKLCSFLLKQFVNFVNTLYKIISMFFFLNLYNIVNKNKQNKCKILVLHLIINMWRINITQRYRNHWTRDKMHK